MKINSLRHTDIKKYLTFCEDVNYIPVSGTQIFENPGDNYWVLQTLLREVMDEHDALNSLNVRAREILFVNKTIRKAVREEENGCITDIRSAQLITTERYLTTSIRKQAIKSVLTTDVVRDLKTAISRKQ